MGERADSLVSARAVQDGDDLPRLFALESGPMVRLATLLVGSGPIAEEIVQDAFAEVGSRWATLDRPGAYLRATVVNGCRAVLRRRSVEDRYRTVLTGPADAELATGLIELSDALQSLTERQRVVIVLRYYADLDDDEIATVLDCQPSSVRSLAHRALIVLRRELA